MYISVCFLFVFFFLPFEILWIRLFSTEPYHHCFLIRLSIFIIPLHSIFVSLQVYIKVIDTNDHRPEFSTSEYQVIIPEDTEPETEILQVSALDRDEKNKLIYTMQSSVNPISLKKFRLDPATGSLYTSETLDHEVMHQHILTVMVNFVFCIFFTYAKYSEC